MSNEVDQKTGSAGHNVLVMEDKETSNYALLAK